ncbi:MAG: hypothetical protein ACFFCQ_16370 [Promethearchaeota archaeon]
MSAFRSEWKIKISRVARHIKKERNPGYRYLSSFPKRLADRIEDRYHRIWGRFVLEEDESKGNGGLILSLNIKHYNHFDVYKLLQQTNSLLQKCLSDPTYRPLAVDEFKTLGEHPAVQADHQLGELFSILSRITEPPPKFVANENLVFISAQLEEIAVTELANYITEEIGLEDYHLINVLKYLVDNGRADEKEIAAKFQFRKGVAPPPEEEKAAATDRMEERLKLDEKDIFMD